MDGVVRLTLNYDSERCVDHVLLATGFRVDIGRYAFLPEDLLRAVNRVDGYPRLSHTFESTLPGLYFLGAPAAWSFGPLMWFVAGTEFASTALAQRVRGKASCSDSEQRGSGFSRR